MNIRLPGPGLVIHGFDDGATGHDVIEAPYPRLIVTDVLRADQSGPPCERIPGRTFGQHVVCLAEPIDTVVGHARHFGVGAANRVDIIDAGYPEFKHGLGRGLGRAVHDGGTLLGPRWPCYGTMTERLVEAGNVFTLELGVMTEAGFVGLEEDVVVTEQGCQFLSSFQRELILV